MAKKAKKTEEKLGPNGRPFGPDGRELQPHQIEDPERRRLTDEERKKNLEMGLDEWDDRDLDEKLAEEMAYRAFMAKMGKPVGEVPKEYPRILLDM